MFHIVWFWIPLIIFIAFNKFKCTSWPARHTHTHPPPQSLKSNPKGIHPTPRQPSLSRSPFKCSKRQTETPCTPRPPPLPCTQHPYFSSWLGTIKCSWEGSSHPDRQVLEWVGGVLAGLWELQPNSCLLVTQTECVAREALWWVPLNLLPLFGPVAFFRGKCCSQHMLSPLHLTYVVTSMVRCVSQKKHLKISLFFFFLFFLKGFTTFDISMHACTFILKKRTI